MGWKESLAIPAYAHDIHYSHPQTIPHAVMGDTGTTRAMPDRHLADLISVDLEDCR